MRPGIGVNVIHALFIDPEANGRRIHGDPLEGIAVLPSPDVFGEVHGIVLVHASIKASRMMPSGPSGMDMAA